MRFTTASLAEKLNVKGIDAHGFVKVCAAAGHANAVDKQKSVSGRGKPSVVYEFDNAVKDLFKLDD